MQPFSDQYLNDIPVRYDVVDLFLLILHKRVAAFTENHKIVRFSLSSVSHWNNVMHCQFFCILTHCFSPSL